jgi:rSAM/selenodomain-associated transferase 1
MKFPNACILQFAKEPRAGHVKTRLISALGDTGALQLHKMLLRHTWDTLNAFQLAPMQLWSDSSEPVAFFNTLCPPVQEPSVQQGVDLGQRMSHAIEQALLQYEMVIVVGSDCPLLDVGYLAEAFESLQQGNDVVLGPASDGGYVLIGMRQFYPELFENVSWGSDQVLSQTRERLRSITCQWHELPERWDVDRPEDLEKLSAQELF